MLIQSVAFSPDGKYLAALGYGRLRMWRREAWQVAGTFDSDSMSGSVVISVDGRYMAVCTRADRPVMLWNMADWRHAP
jgi:hypothetical protein